MRQLRQIASVLTPQWFIQMVASLDCALDLRQQTFVRVERAAGGRVQQQKRQRHDRQHDGDRGEQSAQQIAQHAVSPDALRGTYSAISYGPRYWLASLADTA